MRKLMGKELEEFIESHHVVYIRHSLSSTPEVYIKLISNGIVAVHYTDRLKKGVNSEDLENHKDPENYEDNVKPVMKRFKRFCDEGVIVFADYTDPPNGLEYKAVNIGIIPEHSCFEPKKYLPGDEDFPKHFIYKQVKLCNCVHLSYSEAVPFFAIQPRGGTVVKWNAAEQLVKFVYKRKLGLKIKKESINHQILLPFQQEVLCSEYLRIKAPNEIRIKYFLSPVGRGLKTVDIYGANDTNHIFAQVSLSTDESEIKNKIGELLQLSREENDFKKPILIYFGPHKTKEFVRRIAPKVKFIPLEKVFDEMRNTGVLSEMLFL